LGVDPFDSSRALRAFRRRARDHDAMGPSSTSTGTGTGVSTGIGQPRCDESSNLDVNSDGDVNAEDLEARGAPHAIT
jgi:hypothetical protein